MITPGHGVAARTAGASVYTTRGAFILAVIFAVGVSAYAQQRTAVIITGATGGDAYAQQYEAWAQSLTTALVQRMKFDPVRITVLRETDRATEAASAVNVRRFFAAMRDQTGANDLLLVLLIGHGTYDGVDAKFNLVGPDIESAEWASMLKGIPGLVVVVNTAAASFPFIERLSGPKRIVISATDSPAQRFDTIFPEYFIAALGDDGADIDKNGRISIWEAFAAAAGGVRRHYQQRGQLATERPILDDNGDGAGREAAGQGEDGSLATRTYLDQPDPGAPPTDEVLLQLLQKRAALEAEIEELRIKKAFMAPQEYAREFERVMIELARVARQVRGRAKT